VARARDGDWSNESNKKKDFIVCAAMALLVVGA